MSADDLSEFERRLAGCPPAAGGLDADAMLFAAGRAAARPSRAWPLLSFAFAALSLALGVGLLHERGARLEIAARQTRPAPAVQPGAVPAEPSPAGDAPLLAVHRALEEGRDPWPAHSVMLMEPSSGSLSPVLQPRSLNKLLEP
ncbi:MAG: hypothetical protein ACJ8F7_21160 [Gemmataceae bacterium]